MRKGEKQEQQRSLTRNFSKERKQSKQQVNLIKLWKSFNAEQKVQVQKILKENQSSSDQQNKLDTQDELSRNSQSQSSFLGQKSLLQDHTKSQKKISESDWTLNGLLAQDIYSQPCFLPQPLVLQNITLKSISNIPYQTLFGQLIQMSTLTGLSMNEDTKTQKSDKILQIFQHASESKLIQFSAKSQTLCSILTVTSHISFPCLKVLILNCCQIKSIEMFAWMEMPCLIHLNLEWNCITTLNSLSRASFEKNSFSNLWFNNNMINQFDRFSRMGIKKLQSCRTDSIPAFFQQNRDVYHRRNSNHAQSEDLSFVMKKPFDVQCLRIGNKKRIQQKKVLDCIYRMDRFMYLSK